MTWSSALRLLAVSAGTLLFSIGGVDPARAAGPPIVGPSWVTDVTATSANLRAQINPNGFSTTYRFEYVTQAGFEATGFAGAAKAPPSGTALLGSGTVPLVVFQHIGGLLPATAYRYRPVASNAAKANEIGPEHTLTTQETSLVFRPPDGRGWEMVSPVDKGDGAIAAPGTLFGGGDLQAAAGGGVVTFGSSSSFADPKGAPPASQYVSRRGDRSWIVENVSVPLASAAYGPAPDGTPYRLFSADLGRSLLFGGLPCRGGVEGCPAPTPVLPGSGAPPGYMAYYLRDTTSGSSTSLLSASNVAQSAVSPEAFEVSFAGASSDLGNAVLSSCAKLTSSATEVPAGDGCDETEQNLYRWSDGFLSLVNLLPAQAVGTPGAALAAPIGAVSSDGSKIYWTEGGNLYLRDGSATKQVDVAQGGGGNFQAASADGSVAFFTATTTSAHLFRYVAATGAATDLTPGGEVEGVLAASADGTRVYYQDAAGLKLWHEGATTTIAPGANAAAPSSYPPASGTSRLSADGTRLAFVSNAELSDYDNAGLSEAYIYGPSPGGGQAALVCASCNPTGERPQGASSIAGVEINGTTQAYKPRALSANGLRLFFSSSDELVVQDTNSRPDVYQWEAQGSGDCQRAPGCIGLISSGRSTEGASFVDASEDGSDAFFLTDGSLVETDPGSTDLYDARVEGGFPIPPTPIACIGDACQGLPSPPEDPTPGTLTKNSGNPPASYFSKPKHRRKHRGKRRRKHHGKAR